VRLLAIVNLSSGQSDAGLYQFLRAIGRTGTEITLRFLAGGTTMRDLLRDAEEFDRVVAAGGDGTVSGVCYELRNRNVPVVIYPAGTANLLALNLGMPIDPAELAHIALSGSIITTDLGEIEIGEPGTPDSRRTGFTIVTGAGFDARIMETAQDLKQTIGAAAYLVGAMQNIAPTISRFRLTLDGREVETEGIAVLVANFAKLQFDLSITHHSDPADGVFEVVVLRSKNVAELIPAAWAVLLDRMTGSHPDRSTSLEIHSASDILIEADPPLPVQYDGELLVATTPMRVKALPGAAQLAVPKAYTDKLEKQEKRSGPTQTPRPVSS